MAVEVSHNWSVNRCNWPLQHNDDVVKVSNTDEKFEIGLDTSCFTPKKIEVEISGDELIILFCCKSRKKWHGSVMREINQVYALPPDVSKKTMKLHLTDRGVLYITAQKKPI